MNQIQTIFKNFSWLMASQIIACICGLIWTVLIGRYLGVNDYGILNYAISFTGIIAITMDLGINTHIVRHIATDFDSAPKYLGNAIPLKTLFSFLTFLLALIILIMMKSSMITIQITLLFTLERVFSTMIGLFNGSLQAVEEGEYQAIGNILTNLLLLAFVFLSIIGNFGLYGITLAYLASNAIVVFIQYAMVKKRVSKPKFEFDWEFCKKITLYSIPFALTGLFGGVIYNADMVMLTNMVGSYENGIYSAAYKLTSVLGLFFGVYSTVVFPVMSRFFKNEKNLLAISFQKSLKYLMLFIVPVCFSTILYSTDIVVLFFGKEFVPTAPVLSLLMWTVWISFINGVCFTVLNASHKEKYVTLTYLVATIFNVVLNFIIIPKYSYNGAAITTILSDILITLMCAYSLYNLNLQPQKRLYIDVIKILVASVALYIILSLLNLNMWIALVIGMIIYLAMVYLLRVFDDDDKYILKEIMDKN